MSVSYVAIGWNAHKKVYDSILWGFILLYITLFCMVNLLLYPDVTQETIIIRSTSTLAFLLLHIILCIGPLCRLNNAFLPLLYNRRHLGVSMFCVASVHGVFSIIQFHSLGNINPVLSVFTSNTDYFSLSRFPFQVLGFFALLILMMMAVTSHDFWLNNLSPRIWKSLHMMVYVAYALIVTHVMLGVVQLEHSLIYFVLVLTGVILISALHLAAAYKEKRTDAVIYKTEEEGFHLICSIDEIPDDRAITACLEKERIAVFKYDGKVSAVSNVCKHQNGPLGEGKIIDGCITCPWHGYQYKPADGRAPAPFKEKLKTFEVRIINNKVWLNPKGFEEGTFVEPALVRMKDHA